MSRYHIAASGRPAPCKAASDDSCPLQGKHFRSKDEAQYFLDLAPADISNAPGWLQAVAQEAVYGLESTPTDSQPEWYRTLGRAQAVKAGLKLPALPDHALDQQAEIYYRNLVASMPHEDNEEDHVLAPGIQLMHDELDERLAKAEAALLLARANHGDATEDLDARRLQAKEAGVNYFRLQWAPRFASAENPEEVRSFFLEMAASHTHAGHEAYGNEAGFQEGVKLGRSYVEDYLKLG